MTNKRSFGRFLSFIHRSGIHDIIEARLASDKGGRPRALRVDVFYAAQMAAADDGHTGTMADAHAVLAKLPVSYQKSLGVRTPQGKVLRVHNFYYLSDAIEQSFQHTEAQAPHLDEYERTARREALQEVVDSLLGATTANLPAADRLAIDATSIESFARGKSRGAKNKKGSKNKAPTDTIDAQLCRYSADPDASWGYRTATYGLRNKMFFGYHLTSAVRVGPMGLPDSQPMMTERIQLNPANVSDVPDAIGAIDRHIAQVGPLLEVIVDRGYSYKVAEDWARPLRERNIEQVIDMMPSDHGATTDPLHGYVMLDGWPHDPSVPEHLYVIPRPSNFTIKEPGADATWEERAEYQRRVVELASFNARIAERQLYAYVRHASGKNGAIRFKCPGAAGKLKTDGCAHSAGLPTGIPTSAHPTGILTPTACQDGHATFQIGAHVQEKLRQRYYWGSLEWQQAFARRTAVERTFGYLKSSSTLGTTRGWSQQVGLVKTFLSLAVRVTVMNIHYLDRWAEKTGFTGEPLTSVDISDRDHEEVDDDGNVDLGDVDGPSTPQAA